jgi:general nucleoside transport system ATP-binding protein
MEFADRVTILRHGRVVGGGETADLSPDQMARAMIGAEELAAQPPRVGEFGIPRIEITRLQVSDDAGQPAVRDISLSVRGGEIVGVAGVSGNGQHELVEALAGQRPADAGEIRIGGDLFHATRAEMRRHKLSCLPDEPLRNACVGRMSVAENMAFRSFDRPPFAIGGTWLRPSQIRGDAERRIAQYRVRTRSPDTPLAALSGGNVQRAVLARELDGGAEVMIAANPCFGLDFSAVAQIHAEIVAARNRGAAVLLVSSDLDEILELADRLVVMFNGRLVHEVAAAAADLTEIGRHMAGH